MTRTLPQEHPDGHQRLIKSDFFNTNTQATISNGSAVCDKSRQMSTWSDTKSRDIESMSAIPTVPMHKSMNSNEIRVNRNFNVSRQDTADHV